MNERPTKSPQAQSHSKSADQSLAKILHRRRESLEISLSEAEQATRIRGSYLEAIESGNYDELKDDVYSKGYVRNYADYLGLETKPIIKIYERERAAQREMKRQSRRKAGDVIKLGLQPIRATRMVVTPRTFLIGSVLAMFLVVVGYIGWQVAVLSAPPRLIINSDEPTVVNSNYGFVSGMVDGGADLYINDSPVLVGSDGGFRERIALVGGRNEIKLTAKNRLGKVAVQTYAITAILASQLVTPAAVPLPATVVTPAISPAVSASSSPGLNDGVQIEVKIGESATWIIVEADGKEIFRGTMLAGTTQTFSAADNIKLATGNAGVTRVVLTNKLVQQKDLGMLGASGEIKRDTIWNRDSR